MEKPKAGDELFIVMLGTYGKKRSRVPCTVSKVGRKYFTVEYVIQPNYYIGEESFVISTWKQNTNFTPTARIYRSKQESDDEDEITALHKLLCDAVSQSYRPTYSLDQYRAVCEILYLKKDGV